MQAATGKTATETRLASHSQTWFIPETRLGLLEQAIRQMTTASAKRKRQIEFNSIQQVLKRLRMIDPSCKVISLTYGCLDSGERGLLISTISATKIGGFLPTGPAAYAEERAKDVDER